MKERSGCYPKVINEFEGGPSHLYWGISPHPLNNIGDDYAKNTVLWACKSHSIFYELKITPTVGSISWEKMPLYIECDGIDECIECEQSRCPKPIEEVGERGSGMQITEVLEGWFIDLGKCTPWKVCECCNGKGYFESEVKA